MKSQNVTIYTTNLCHFCVKAKEYLKSKGVPYTEHNVQMNPQMGMEMVKKSGQMGVPVIEVDSTIIIGFNKQKLDALLT